MRPPTWILAGVAMGLLVLACRPLAPRPAELTLELPENWTAASPEGAVEEAPWWNTFESSSLQASILEALQANHDLGVAAARVEAAWAEARIAGADRLPGLNAGASGQRQKQVFVDLPFPGANVQENHSTSYGVSLDVSWELDVWGRLAAQHEAARAEARASESDYRAARHSIAAQTAKAWFAWREAEAQRELAQRTVESFERTTRLVRRRFENGLASALDLRLARSQESAARALLELTLQGRDRTARQLELLMGRYPAATVRADHGLPPLPPTPPAGLPAEILARRPDLVAARDRLRSREAGLEASRGALLPSLSLTASTGLVSDDLDDFVDGDFGVWSIAGNLVQPIFQGGRLRAGVDRSEAFVREALEAFAQITLFALAEVELALRAEELLARRELHLRASTEEAQLAAELAQSRYDAGLEQLVTVLEAQRRSLESEGTWLSVLREQLEARVDLHLSLGGGFDLPPSTDEAGESDESGHEGEAELEPKP